MRSASLLDTLIDGMLGFGVLLGSVVATAYLVRVLLGVILNDNTWYWGSVLACASVPVLFAAARWLHIRSAYVAIRTESNA